MSYHDFQYLTEQIDDAPQVRIPGRTAAVLSARLRRGTRRTFAGLRTAVAAAGPADTDFRARPSAVRWFAARGRTVRYFAAGIFRRTVASVLFLRRARNTAPALQRREWPAH